MPSSLNVRPLAVMIHACVTSSRALLVAALLPACTTPSATPDAISVVDSAGVRITRIEADPARLDEWTLAPNPRIVLTGTETGDSSAFSPVGNALWLSGGDIVIADLGDRRLLVYDSLGAFQHALGRLGDGPGEFRRMGALSTPGGDTVAVFDAQHRALSYWHARAGYLRRVSVSEGESLDAWPADAWAWRDASMVVLQLAITPLDSLPGGAKTRLWPMRAHLTLRDSTGVVRAVSAGFAGMYTAILERGGDMRVAFSNNPFAAVGGRRVYFGSGQAFALSTLAANFDSVGEIRWPVVEEQVTVQEVERLRAERVAGVGSQLPPDRLQRLLDLEFAPELVPSSRPSIGRVLVDGEDRVWVERFEPARLGSRTQTPGALWHVLAPDGRPVERLRLPPRTRLEAVRDGQALVMQRDSLDVESVAVYPIVR